MSNEKYFRETNALWADLLIPLGKFLEHCYPSDKCINVEFYQHMEKRHIDIYVLVFFNKNDNFTFLTEDVEASLLLFEDGRFVDTDKTDKDLFVKEHGFFKFNFFMPDVGDFYETH